MVKKSDVIEANDVTEEVKEAVIPRNIRRIEASPIIRTSSEIDVLANPQDIMNNAIKVSKILKDVVDKSKKKSIIVVNNNEYLMFSAWQTISQFYGFTAQTEWTKKIEKDGRFMGYEAKSVLVNLRNGQTYPGAEASCLVSEVNWGGKPEFTLKSMAQTRACSKTLANKFRWVAVLAGYEGTPGEEISAEIVNATPSYDGATGGSDSGRGATPNQLKFVRKSFTWKKLSVARFEELYKPIDSLTFDDAKKMLDYLFKEKKPTLESVLALFGIKDDAPPPSNEPDPEWIGDPDEDVPVKE